MTSTYLDGLNQKQKEAVTSKAKYLQILAGPGSGKTRVLTTRVAHIIKHHNISPTQILVATFTKKASKEMRERLEKDELLGPTLASQINMGTFHSLCAQYLRQNTTAARLPNDFRIIDPQEGLLILEKIVEERIGSISSQSRSKLQSYKGMAGEFQTLIAKSKSEGFTADLYAQRHEGDMFPTVHDAIMIFCAYEQRLSLQHLVDFDDLLLYGRELFEHHPQVAADIKHILVDEFQDTNRVQYDIVYRLCRAKKHLTIVGDPDQCIYGFRNANIANFKLMAHDFKGVEMVNLEQNYRSTSFILETAVQIIQRDPERIEKGLFTKNSRGTPLALLHCKTEVDEGHKIAAEISRIIEYSHGLVKYKDIAVLVRMHYLTQNMESVFKLAGIPYEIIGGVRFFNRVEIRDLVSYIHFIFNPNDTISFERIINTPRRGVGDQLLKKISTLSNVQQKSVLQVLQDLCTRDFGNEEPRILGYRLPPETMENIKNFVNLCATVKMMMDNKDSVEGILNYIIEKSNYESYLRASHKDHDIRWENVGELISVAHSHDKVVSHLVLEDGNQKVVGDMDAFIARTALDPDGDDTSPEERDKVQMMTIHAAKGLEWPCVFIVACEDSIIPHMKCDNQNEERRLMYVAMTRAKCFLYGSYVQTRVGWGQPKKSTLSRFLIQLDETFYQRRTPAWDKDSRAWVASVLKLPAPEEKQNGNDSSMGDDTKAMDHPGDEFADLNQSLIPQLLAAQILGRQITGSQTQGSKAVVSQPPPSQVTALQILSSRVTASQTSSSSSSSSSVGVSQTLGPQIPRSRDAATQTQEPQTPGSQDAATQTQEPQTPGLQTPGSQDAATQTLEPQTPGSQTVISQALGLQTSGLASPRSQTPQSETLEWQISGSQTEASQSPGTQNELKRIREEDDLADYDFSDYDLTDYEHLSDFEISYDSDFGISDGDDLECPLSKKPRETIQGSL